MFNSNLITVGLSARPQRSWTIRVNRTAVRSRISASNFAYIALSLSLLFGAGTTPVTFLKSLAFDISSTVIPLVDQPFQALGHSFTHIKNLVQTQETLYQEIALLRQQNTHLLKWQTMAQELSQHNERLRSCVNFVDNNPQGLVTVRVTSFQSFEQGQYLLIEGGTAAGLAKNQPVTTPQGIVGRIIEVGQRMARVLLLTDINSRVPVTVAGTDCQAILAGNNTNTLEVTRLASQTTLKVGDRLLTSGHGFPAGLPVAEITAITQEGVMARPLASPSTPFVMVLQS
ncbi:MAG: rod shape-determining protein MreC [Alphaproteobacteria bacterium]